MVARCRSDEPVLIFDLDGTILSANSFPRWALYLARARFGHLGRVRRLAISLAALSALARRKLGLMSHAELKWKLQRLWQQATEGDGGSAQQLLVAELQGLVRPEFRPLLARVAQGEYDAVLATAAAGDYAEDLGRVLGFVHILATPPGRAAREPDYTGRHKRHAVEDFLRSRNWQTRPLTLFTDHIDDLPLIRISRTTHWFGTPQMQRWLELQHPDLDLRSGLGDHDEHAFFA